MENIKKMFKSVSSRHGSYSVGLAVIVLAIAIVINLVAGQLPENIRKIDISDNRLYEITDVSKEMLGGLEKEIKFTVIAELDSVFL